MMVEASKDQGLQTNTNFSMRNAIFQPVERIGIQIWPAKQQECEHVLRTWGF